MPTTRRDPTSKTRTTREVWKIVSRVLSTGQVSKVLETLQDQLPSHVRPFVVGGLLRDSILMPERARTDIDVIVFNTKSADALAEWVDPYLVRRTTFGGSELRINDCAVDIWRAEQQASVSRIEKRSISPGEAMDYITLTVNAIAASFDGVNIYGSGFMRSMNDRTIHAGRRSVWLSEWKPYHLAHTAYTQELTSYSLGARLASEVLQTTPPERKQAAEYLSSRKNIFNSKDLIDFTIESSLRTIRENPTKAQLAALAKSTTSNVNPLQPV